jgi:hypothetical protein
MENYNGIGSEIIEGGIFERFPELTPFVGENYSNKNHSKLLLIGESNYFPDELASKSVFKDAKKWYHGKDCHLIPEEMKEKVNNDGKIVYLRGLFSTIQKLLNTIQYDDVAFYNYFLRPASVKNKNGDSDLGLKKNYTDLDGEVAFVAFCGVLESLKPDIVIFASTLAWNKMEVFQNLYKKNFGEIVIKKVSHPSSPWWNNSNGAYGRQLFEDLLTKHWIKKFQKLQTIHRELILKFNLEREQECFFDGKGNYLSCLYFRVKDSTFCCETGVTINSEDFWTCFYETDNCKKIPALENKKVNLTRDLSDDIIVEKIEKLINQIIEEI